MQNCGSFSSSFKNIEVIAIAAILENIFPGDLYSVWAALGLLYSLTLLGSVSYYLRQSSCHLKHQEPSTPQDDKLERKKPKVYTS